MSRSCRVLHAGHVHSRTDNGNSLITYPHAEHVLLLA